MENQTNGLKSTIMGSILILLFELIGSTFLTLLFLCNGNVSWNNYFLHILK
jgi:hypothetical protein